MVGEEKRHQMMQNLFGDDQSEEEEVESEHESNRQPDSNSDEGDGGPEPDGEDDGEEVEGQGEVELPSEGEREQSPQQVEVADQREESEARYSESDEEKEEYGQNNVTSQRREVVDSGSERSGDNNNHYYAADAMENEPDHARSPGRSTGDEKDEDQFRQSAPEIRDVFGDSDEEEEEAGYEDQKQMDDGNQSPMDEDEEQHGKEPRLEDMIPDEDAPNESEDDHMEARYIKEKPTGPPIELEFPLCYPPAESKKMHMIKVSNIMGIDRKPFDRKTYVEEDYYVTDESGSKKKIRLENNVVRWRKVKRPDGNSTIESNARFVEWSDGSIQLHIGNEVLNISKQDSHHEQAHLFIRHGKGILQSQGRVLTKMKFMPSSLSSNSHRLLTALVDSRTKKVYKLKNCVTNIDPEREKEQKEKAVSQSIRANVQLSRKKEKVRSKYTQPIRREQQLSPGFLEDPEEEDREDYYEPHSRRSAGRHRFDDDMEEEARAEKRINAKKGSSKSAFQATKRNRRPVEFSESEREESEYETEGEEEGGSPYRKRDAEEADQYADEDEEPEQEAEEDTYNESEEEIQEQKQKSRSSGGSIKRKDINFEDDSPPRKSTTAHRRMKMVYESDED